MFLRILFFGALGFLLLKILGKILPSPPKRGPQPPGSTHATGQDRPLVRVACCELFLDPELALVRHHKGKTLYFCSEACALAHTATGQNAKGAGKPIDKAGE